MQREKTKKTKWELSLFLALGLLTVFSIILFATKSQYQSRTKTVSIGGVKLVAEIATTSQELQKGLCCRDFLSPNSGMLFVFNEDDYHSFWMKDTKIPLDIIWIDYQKKIVDIVEYVRPESFPQSFKPQAPARYVLEANAGWVSANNIRVGDRVTF